MLAVAKFTFDFMKHFSMVAKARRRQRSLSSFSLGIARRTAV
jgi:hypothetical protein